MRSIAKGLPIVGAAFVVSLAFAACNKSEETKSSDDGDAGADEKKVALDPELAQAMAAASVGAPARGQPQADGGPPPNGMFAPGAADKEAAKGSAPRVVLGSEGSDPKVSLSPARPDPGKKLSGKVQVSVQQGQGGGLPIE